MSLGTHLRLAGYGLAAIYAVFGLLELLVVGDGQAATIFGASAVVTGALVAVLIPLLTPEGDEPEDEGGGPPGGGGPPPPPWWPDFERDFWSHVGRASEPSGTRREKTPA